MGALLRIKTVSGMRTSMHFLPVIIFLIIFLVQLYHNFFKLVRSYCMSKQDEKLDASDGYECS